ncbi:unnamed protein product [Allacma fusca]|uniref:ATP-dependent RNA helicase n=1 Tax=Allacma fusca TaxID=39272 RepID=A0A8J2MCZ2_9HEXA|nr:unnamed protein product [Allacma fusca]
MRVIQIVGVQLTSEDCWSLQRLSRTCKMVECNVDPVTLSELEPKRKKKKSGKAHETTDTGVTGDNEESLKGPAVETEPSGKKEGTEVKKNPGLKAKRKKKKNVVPIGNTSLGTDVGGFTVIGDVNQFKQVTVKRVLPEWLQNPSIVSCNLRDATVPVENFNLDPNLVKLLHKNFIPYFFPVQQQVIPWLLEHHNPKLVRPPDMCVSAPTGSGKTLAYALPLIQILQRTMSSNIRAIVVLPTEILASQVFSVFQTYSKGTILKVFLMAKRMTLSAETRSLIHTGLDGQPRCSYDIIVATPGRLIDHLEQTEGFDISNLKFLVVDEADRTLDDQEGDWLHRLEIKFWSHFNTEFAQPWKSLPLNVKSMSMHLKAFHKLLFSATLSQNPETLEKLHLFQPKLFTSIIERKSDNKNLASEGTSATADSFVGKFTTPTELKESFVLVQKETKPLVLAYLIAKNQWKRILCFANTNEATHRLCVLLSSMGSLQVREITSKWSAHARDLVIKKFVEGSIDILVTSDQLARGIDIPLVDHVISYDVPGYTKTYIHRIGRTARAGREGQAITLVTKDQIGIFRRTIKTSGKSNVERLIIKNSELRPYQEKYKKALVDLKSKVEEEAEKGKFGRGNNRANKRASPSKVIPEPSQTESQPEDPVVKKKKKKKEKVEEN